MIRPQRYWVVALKRAAITSITSRQTGNCSAIILADNSVSTIADDSSGSRKPAASPTATQLRFQKGSRWPGRTLMQCTVSPSDAGTLKARKDRQDAGTGKGVAERVDNG